MDNESLEMTISFNNKEEILNILHPLMNGLLHPYFVIEKNEELKSIFKDVNYNDSNCIRLYTVNPFNDDVTWNKDRLRKELSLEQMEFIFKWIMENCKHG